MKILPLSILLLVTLHAHAAAPAYQIKGSVKTLDKEKGAKIDRRGGTAQKIEREQALIFEVRRTNPTIGEHAMVEWVVVMEGAQGNPYLGTYGKQQIHSAVGIPVELESEPFTSQERTFNGDRKLKYVSRGEDLKGYGVRVLDSNGQEIGSKFHPASVEEDARKVFAFQAQKEQKAANNEAASTRNNRKKQRRMLK